MLGLDAGFVAVSLVRGFMARLWLETLSVHRDSLLTTKDGEDTEVAIEYPKLVV